MVERHGYESLTSAFRYNSTPGDYNSISFPLRVPEIEAESDCFLFISFFTVQNMSYTQYINYHISYHNKSRIIFLPAALPC